MQQHFQPDNLTEADVVGCLQRANLKFQSKGRYIVSQCPTHNDKNPSTQIFKDDWFVNCLAGCGRYHITKAFPELRGHAPVPLNREVTKPMPEYKTFDLLEKWQSLPPIKADLNFKFKGIPLEILDELGWRQATPDLSMGQGWFIPYFNQNKTKVPFAQVRHLSGERRFTFLKDAKPTVYGGWNIYPNEIVFLVEGASDAAVMQTCSVPWVALPSASSGELLKRMAVHAKSVNCEIVYAGDNDDAGDKLKDALAQVMPYRVKQPPKPYKDWGEFFEAEGMEAVMKYTWPTLGLTP